MKILVLSDVESNYLWDGQNPKKLQDIDLILSCGDLQPEYLSFIATFTHAPVFYIHGNHDDRYLHTPPEGCICIDNMLLRFQGLRILGLGGSMRYRNGVHQYTQFEMNWRVFRLYPSLLRHRGFDILLTHAPASGINDGKDLPHQGFTAFRRLLDTWHPDIMIHGHTHLNYGSEYRRTSTYHSTTIINAYEKYIINYPENRRR
ncbi:MAG: metallophosphoesterase family protein [Ruminococcus sp.]|jgi:predicted phosphodiesterase